MMSLRTFVGVRPRVLALVIAVTGLWTVGLAGLSPGTALATSTCNLGNGIQHVVILQFDNVHSERDNPNVPSDLEQMPALRGFITGNGTLLNERPHDPDLAHLGRHHLSRDRALPRPERDHGWETRTFFDPSTTSGSTFSSAFKYWTDPTSTTDPKPTLITQRVAKNDPRAVGLRTRAHGCDFAGDRRRRHGAREHDQVDVTTPSSEATPRPRRPPVGPQAPPTSRASRRITHCSAGRTAPPAACAQRRDRHAARGSRAATTGYKGAASARSR